MSYRKAASHVPADFFAAEAAGLTWLAETGTVPVVEVISSSPHELVLERLAEVPATSATAREFGADLARLHTSGCPDFGTLPPGVGRYWFGPLSQPLEIETAVCPSMGQAYAVRLESLARLLPEPSAALAGVIERTATGAFDDAAAPARTHGDLWSGNLLFTARGGTLIDPAAIAGHPLSDIAMLSLFGAPQLEEILSGWAAHYPVADIGSDWRELVGLHQLFGLTAHAVLFGGPYRASAERLARRYA